MAIQKEIDMDFVYISIVAIIAIIGVISIVLIVANPGTYVILEPKEQLPLEKDPYLSVTDNIAKINENNAT